jgi:PAS domain S-box-containing protein
MSDDQESRDAAAAIDDADPDISPDLAHLKRLSRELLDPELYVRLVEMLGVAIVVVNPRGEIIVFNAQAELLFGYRRIEIMGHAVEILVPDVVRPQHEAHRKKFDEEPRARPMGIDLPLMGRHKTGRGIAVEINLVPIPTTNGICTAAVVWRKR